MFVVVICFIIPCVVMGFMLFDHIKEKKHEEQERRNYVIEYWIRKGC